MSQYLRPRYKQLMTAASLWRQTDPDHWLALDWLREIYFLSGKKIFLRYSFNEKINGHLEVSEEWYVTYRFSFCIFQFYKNVSLQSTFLSLKTVAHVKKPYQR